jgi:hypothetical protein
MLGRVIAAGLGAPGSVPRDMPGLLAGRFIMGDMSYSCSI